MEVHVLDAKLTIRLLLPPGLRIVARHRWKHAGCTSYWKYKDVHVSTCSMACLGGALDPGHGDGHYSLRTSRALRGRTISAEENVAGFARGCKGLNVVHRANGSATRPSYEHSVRERSIAAWYRVLCHCLLAHLPRTPRVIPTSLDSDSALGTLATPQPITGDRYRRQHGWKRTTFHLHRRALISDWLPVLYGELATLIHSCVK